MNPRNLSTKIRASILKYPKKWTGGFILLFLWLACLPKPLFRVPYSAVLEDRSGSLLGARIAPDGQWRFPMSDTLPEKYVQSLLCFEDQYFQYHPGVNPVSTFRALRQNLGAGHTVSGGSTLTMQVIRMARGNPERTLGQKLLEMIMATRLELTYSKKSILRLYAAHAPYGGNVVGLEAAAWRYYAKRSGQLTWAEAALLAILPNSPALIHPGRGREKLLAKRNRLLERLQANGLLDTTELELAKSEPLPDKPHPLPQLAPHLLSRLQAESSKKDKNAAIFRTSIDKNIQNRVTEALARRQEAYRGNEVHNLAAIVIDVQTGGVLAYVGNVQGAGQQHGEDVDMIVAPRSTGSILKPYLFGWALQGGDILPHALLEDVPTQFGGYRPENYRETYDGLVPAQTALVRSLNVPFVNLLRQHGLEKFHHELKQLGLSSITKSADHYGLTLILGGAEGKLGEITNVYASMARRLGAYYRRNGKSGSQDFGPYTLLHDQAKINDEGLQKQATGLSPGAIWHTFLAMQEVERPNYLGEWQMFNNSRRIAWKTGTSFGFRDAWAVGANARYAVGVWVGNADGEGRPGLIGVDIAAPVLFELFNFLPGGDDWFDPPYDDMVQLPICHESGYRAQQHCTPDTLWVPRTGVNAPTCTYHQLAHLDPTGQFQVTTECESPERIQHRPWMVIDPAVGHYYQIRHPSYQPLPPFRPDCPSALAEVGKSPLRVVYPAENAQIAIPIDLDGKRGSVIGQATHRSDGSEIYWHLDDQFVGRTKTFHQLPLQPGMGKHTITLVDEKGARCVRKFEVVK